MDDQQTLLEYLTNPPETNWYKHERLPVYRHKDYVDALERDYLSKGLAFERAKFEFDDLEDPVTVRKPLEREFPDPKHVPVTVTVMKNNKVKVTCHTAWTNLWERYYDKGRSPPLRAIVQAYKAIGCDDDFLKKVIKSHDAKVRDGKILAKHIQKVFKMQEKKKKVTKKAVAAEEEAETSVTDDEDDEDEHERENHADDDDEGFDMETADEDDDVVDDAVLSDVEL
jgi:hypothetical protein